MKTVTFEKTTPKKRMSSIDFIIEMVGKPIANGLLAVFFLLSTHFMLKEMAEKLKIVGSSVALCFFAVVVLSFGFQVLKVKKVKYIYQILISLGELCLISIGIWRYVVANLDTLERNARYVFNQVYSYINDYYGLSLNPYEETGDAAPMLMSLVVFAVVLFAQILFQLTGKRFVYALCPVLVFAGFIAVGETPGFAGVAVAFVTVIFSILVDRFQSKNWVALPSVLAVVIILSLGTNFLFSAKADAMASNMSSLMSWQKSVAEKLAGISFGFGNSSFMNHGAVNNSYPSFTGKEVMKIEMEGFPHSSVYMRGYWGDTYEGGRWSYNDFYSAVEDDIVEPKVLAEKRFLSGDGVSNYEARQLRYTLLYTDLKDEYAYLPYTAKPTATDFKNFKINGDYNITRSTHLSRAEFTGLENDAGFREFSGENLYGVPVTYIELPRKRSGAHKNEALYNQFVKEHYLAVPDNLEYLDDALYYVNPDNYDYEAYINYVDCMSAFKPGAYHHDYNEVEYVQAAVNYIHNYFDNYFKYESQLESSGTLDPVDYFLDVSHKGFCVHFASAGTLLLRKLGIPARYCTGYVAFKNDFKLKSESKGSEASVKDSSAHAWCEVYLSGFGWIPVEFTPGYTVGGGKLEKDINDLPKPPASIEDTESEEPSESEADTTVEDPKETEAVTETEVVTESETTSESQVDSEQNSDASELQEGGTGESQNTQRELSPIVRRVLFILGILIGISVIVVAFILLLRKRRQAKALRLKRLIRCENYNQAARLINRQVYKDLRRRNLSMKKNLSNDEFAKYLTETYENFDGAAYVRVMSKVVYSKEKLTKEEFDSICITGQLKPRTSRTEKASE